MDGDSDFNEESRRVVNNLDPSAVNTQINHLEGKRHKHMRNDRKKVKFSPFMEHM